jgi:hypothetical protein
MKQNSRIAVAVDTCSSVDDDDDGCDGEFVKSILSSHTQSSTRWMEMEEKLIN